MQVNQWHLPFIQCKLKSLDALHYLMCKSKSHSFRLLAGVCRPPCQDALLLEEKLSSITSLLYEGSIKCIMCLQRGGKQHEIPQNMGLSCKNKTCSYFYILIYPDLYKWPLITKIESVNQRVKVNCTRCNKIDYRQSYYITFPGTWGDCDLRLPKCNQWISEYKWTFVPNLKKFPWADFKI